MQNDACFWFSDELANRLNRSTNISGVFLKRVCIYQTLLSQIPRVICCLMSTITPLVLYSKHKKQKRLYFELFFSEDQEQGGNSTHEVKYSEGNINDYRLGSQNQIKYRIKHG